MTTARKLIADSEASEAESCGLRLVECVARVRLATASVGGQKRAEIDADLNAIRALALRVVERLAESDGVR